MYLDVNPSMSNHRHVVQSESLEKYGKNMLG